MVHANRNRKVLNNSLITFLPTKPRQVLARHRRPTAHARARYRCFLPDLAGLAGRRRAGPMPDLTNSSKGFSFTLLPLFGTLYLLRKFRNN